MTTTPTVGNAVTFSFDPLATLPQVTALADDTFVLAWQDGSDIFARHLNELGGFTGGDFLQTLSSNDAQPLSAPHLYQQADGSVMLTYARLFGTSDADIASHRVNAGFTPDGNATPVEQTSIREFLLDSAATPSGGVVAFRVPGAGADSRIELRFVDTQGNPVGNRVFLAARAGETQQNGGLAVLPNGTVVIAYEDVRNTTTARDIRFHLISPSGFDSGAVPISATDINAAFPDVAVLADGDFVVAWQQNGGLAMRHMLQSGQLAGGVVTIPGTFGALVPKLTALDDGGFMLAWTAISGTESDGSGDLDIFLQRFDFDASGNIAAVGAQVHIDQAGDQGLQNLSMTTLADGRVLITYRSETGDATNVDKLEYRFIDPRDHNLAGDNSDNMIVGREDASSISGLAGNDRLIGRNAGDTLVGGEGDDLLDGGLGNDRLDGGAGVDTATFRNAAAAVNVDLSTGTATGQGNDTLDGIENVTGSALADTITGNGGANIIDGGGGADLLRGLGGNDVYVVDNAGDKVLEAVSGGSDTVVTGVSYALAAGQAIEILAIAENTGTAAINLTGNEFAQTLIGNSGENVIDGKGGADTMTGGGGNDRYFVDNIGDVVGEWIGWGALDQVLASVSYRLGAGVEVEKLSTTNAAGTAAINLTGNEFAQAITGNAGANIIDGKGGADTMTGLGGNDRYLVDNASDVVVEKAGGGADRVMAGVSYALAAGQSIETLTTANSAGTAAINLTGNELAQTIVGNAGANVIDGKGGADTMIGLGGDDRYIVDNAGDVVVEATGGGDDRIITSVSTTLGAGQSIEELGADSNSRTAIDLTGNEFSQLISGNEGDNVIDGKGGADTMRGFGGNDIYFVDDAGDQVFENAGGGTDQVRTSVSYALAAGQEIELLATADFGLTTAALNLTGNEFAQQILGNAGDNVIDGKGGADAMFGNGGNDTYFVDNARDQVVEFAGQGFDRVLASVSYALAAGQSIETLTTTSSAGTAAINLAGNEFAQTIIGNAGANFIDGRGGADTMSGLGGADIYRVDNAGDRVIEAAGGDFDTVVTSVSYALGAGQGIEMLRTTDGMGSSAINLTGNELAQTILGNSGDNVINGKGGADTMIGNGGSDTYFVDNAGDRVLENADNDTDRVLTSVSYSLAAGVAIEKLTTTSSAGTTAIDLAGNEFAQTIIGNAGKNIIAGGAGNDTLAGLGGADSFLFDRALNAATNVDRITDFSVADDTIRLDDAIFDVLTATGALSAGAFFTGSAAHDADDRIIYNSTTGALIYDSNGNAAGGETVFATVSPGLALTHLDFFVV